MHLFEWLGLLLLFLCGIATGYVLALFEQRRTRQAEGFLSLLRHVRMQIDCFCLPVPEILARLDRELLTDCGAPEGAQNFPALLSQTKLWLPDEACALLADFSKDLGSSYGTFLKGHKLQPNVPAELKMGDRFTLGSEREAFVVTGKGGK